MQNFSLAAQLVTLFAGIMIILDEKLRREIKNAGGDENGQFSSERVGTALLLVICNLLTVAYPLVQMVMAGDLKEYFKTLISILKWPFKFCTHKPVTAQCDDMKPNCIGETDSENQDVPQTEQGVGIEDIHFNSVKGETLQGSVPFCENVSKSVTPSLVSDTSKSQSSVSTFVVLDPETALVGTNSYYYLPSDYHPCFLAVEPSLQP
jgi:hypothetical protein